MNAGVTFERVYRALKDQLASGRHVPGQHLEPAALSHELNASITPVRDALHRLAGEGLVETPRGEGFRVPHLTEVGLRHLYRWHGTVVDLALRGRGRGPLVLDTPVGGDADVLARTDRLFNAIGMATGNPEHAAALARLNDRLRPIRQVELRLVEDGESELAFLEHRFDDVSSLPLRRSLAAYHRRRERLVAELVAALHGSG